MFETFTIRATFTVTAQHSWIFSPPLDFTRFNIPVSSINQVITKRSQICNVVYFQQIIDSAQQGPKLHVVSYWEHFKSTSFMQILLSRRAKATKNVSFKHFDNYLFLVMTTTGNGYHLNDKKPQAKINHLFSKGIVFFLLWHRCCTRKYAHGGKENPILSWRAS